MQFIRILVLILTLGLVHLEVPRKVKELDPLDTLTPEVKEARCISTAAHLRACRELEDAARESLTISEATVILCREMNK